MTKPGKTRRRRCRSRFPCEGLHSSPPTLGSAAGGGNGTGHDTRAPREPPPKRSLPRLARGPPLPAACALPLPGVAVAGGEGGGGLARRPPPPPPGGPAAWPGPRRSQPPARRLRTTRRERRFLSGKGRAGRRRGRPGPGGGCPGEPAAPPPLAPLLLTSHCGASQQRVGSKPCPVSSNQSAGRPPAVDWLLLASQYPIGRLL